jgi:cell division protein FtsB
LETSDIRDELLSEIGSRPILRARHLVWIGIVAALALYVYYLLYGANSFLRLLELRDEDRALQTRVEQLKSENAKLRRELYELELISGEEEP